MNFAVLAALAFVFSLVPALLFLSNLRVYRAPRRLVSWEVPRLSVLIPARNEAATIRGSVEAVLATVGVNLELIVLDDDSEDATAQVVAEIAAHDRRVTLLTAPSLPAGWCGKQHACATLANAARYETLVFLDADVRLAPDGLIRMADFLEESGADLASGIPRQVTGSLLERLVIPLIHFVLLGFLPFGRMRRFRDPRYAAGCGQLFITRRGAYEQAGGHASIRESLHDGITLPRAFRLAGLRTDLFDATELASCRMYQGGFQVWHGLAKNAVEGLGSPRLIVPMTALLVVGQVLPLLLLAGSRGRPWAMLFSVLAVLCSYLPRIVSASRFQQSSLSVVLHPAGVLVLVAIQWYALARATFGRPARWKGRRYPVAGSTPSSL